MVYSNRYVYTPKSGNTCRTSFRALIAQKSLHWEML